MKRLLVLLCAGSIAVGASAQAQDDALYRALGAQAGIKRIMESFVPLVLADARIKDQFTDIDMAHLSMRLQEQFCVLGGGPCTYKGKDMVTIHDGLNITNAQFNALTEDLQEAMERNGVPSGVQNKLIAKLAPMQRDIVTK